MSNEDTELKKLPKTLPKGWIQRLKEESWEAELLVSAIAIYGTFQLFGVIDWAANSLIDVLNPNQYLVGYCIVFFGLFAISILTAMFVIHFFLRAYWIGLVGLNSVFPDYSIEDSVYSKKYTEKMLTILPKLEESIKKVDELCSVIFSAAFTFLLIYMYLAFFASVYLLLYNLLSAFVPPYILLIPLGIVAIIFIGQMIVTLVANFKGNKEKDKLQVWSFKIAKSASILMYGPLYKYILQVSMIFGSNFKKKKTMVYLMLAFLFSGAMLAVFQMDKTNIPYLITTGMSIDEDETKVNYNYYESQNSDNTFLLTPEIESDIIKNNVVKVFIPIFKNESKKRDEICDDYVKDNSISKAEQRRKKRLKLLNCYHKYNIIYLNDERINVEYFKYTHHRTKQFGVIGYVPLSKLKAGMNVLTVKKEYGDDDVKVWTIPFYNGQNF